jgi:hypothetical protein
MTTDLGLRFRTRARQHETPASTRGCRVNPGGSVGSIRVGPFGGAGARALQPLSTRTIAIHCGQPAATRNGSTPPPPRTSPCAPPPRRTTHHAPRRQPAPCQIPVPGAKSQLQPRFDPGERAISGSQPSWRTQTRIWPGLPVTVAVAVAVARQQFSDVPRTVLTPANTRRPHEPASAPADEFGAGRIAALGRRLSEAGAGAGSRPRQQTSCAQPGWSRARLAGRGSRPRDPKRPPSPCRRQHACRRRSSPART